MEAYYNLFLFSTFWHAVLHTLVRSQVGTYKSGRDEENDANSDEVQHVPYEKPPPPMIDLDSEDESLPQEQAMESDPSIRVPANNKKKCLLFNNNFQACVRLLLLFQ